MVASLGYALMKLVGCVLPFRSFPLRFSLQKNQLTLRPGWTNLTTFFSECCGLRMPHSNLVDKINLRGFRAHISPASLIYPNVIRSGTIERRDLIEFFRVANFVFRALCSCSSHFPPWFALILFMDLHIEFKVLSCRLQ